MFHIEAINTNAFNHQVKSLFGRDAKIAHGAWRFQDVVWNMDDLLTINSSLVLYGSSETYISNQKTIVVIAKLLLI